MVGIALAFKGTQVAATGEHKIVVPPDVPIMRYETGGAADLKAVVSFTVFAATKKKTGGTFDAARINVGAGWDGVAAAAADIWQPEMSARPQ